MLTIFYVHYSRSFPQNLNHWVLEKSELINLQMLIQKNTFNVLSAQQCLPRLLWRGRYFGTCEILGSSPVKMSQAFYDPSICFNFLYFHRKVNTFKTPEMCLHLDSDVFELDVLQLFLQDLFIILSRFLAGSCSVKMSQAFHDPSINFHRAWER